ncbi:MAG TPA: NrdJb [Stenotrophomonas sp.]|nr:NrdJb [Stenotrophomonas sp.]
MAVRIDQKITGYAVLPTGETLRAPAADSGPAAAVATDNIVQMHERIERPDVLVGNTYKIKSPLVEHAFYVTINDIVLNPGTEHELRRPFEVFINSKSMEHFQWIVALTRIMSAVFRKGGDVTFLVEEMKAVFDPRGGYYKAGGVYMPSLVAELGSIVEAHLKAIGLLHDPELSPGQRALIAQTRHQYQQHVADSTADHEQDLTVTGEGTGFPPSASVCQACSTKALVLLDGCATCLNCGYSKCG